MHVQIRARNRCCAPGAVAASPGVAAMGHWFLHDVAFRHERGILCAVLAGLSGCARHMQPVPDPSRPVRTGAGGGGIGNRCLA